MSKFSYTFPAILIAIIAIGIAAWSFLKIGNTVATKDFPINLPNKSIASINVSYSFIGTLTEIKTTPEKTELITDIQIPNLPKLIVVPGKTQIMDTSSSLAKKVTLANLKKGQKLRIAITYLTATKSWNIVSAVFILPK